MIIGLREQRTVSIVYVSHDLGVVRNLVDAVAVMYGGRVVETGPSTTSFAIQHIRTRGDCSKRCRGLGRDTRELRGIPGQRCRAVEQTAGMPVRAAL